MRNPWVAIFLIIALGLVALAGFHEAGSEREHDILATGLPLASSGVQLVVEGVVEPKSGEIRLTAAQAGHLATVLVEEGDTVKQRQVLATLENADQAARTQAAEAALAVARAGLDRLMQGASQAERDEAKARVQEAQAALALADQTLKREQGRDEGPSEEDDQQHQWDLDHARREQELALAHLDQARYHLEAVTSPPRADEQAAAEAEVVLASARLDEARALYEKSLVRSPIEGVVLRQFRHVGESVTATDDSPIFILGDTRVLRVRAEIGADDVARIALGQSATIQADAYGDRRFSGSVTHIGKLMGPAHGRAGARMLDVLIDLEPGAPLPVGLRVNVALELEPGEGTE